MHVLLRLAYYLATAIFLISGFESERLLLLVMFLLGNRSLLITNLSTMHHGWWSGILFFLWTSLRSLKRHCSLITRVILWRLVNPSWSRCWFLITMSEFILIRITWRLQSVWIRLALLVLRLSSHRLEKLFIVRRDSRTKSSSNLFLLKCLLSLRVVSRL